VSLSVASRMSIIDVGLSCIYWRASYHQVKTLPEEAAALGCMDYQAKVKAYDTVVKCVVIHMALISTSLRAMPRVASSSTSTDSYKQASKQFL